MTRKVLRTGGTGGELRTGATGRGLRSGVARNVVRTGVACCATALLAAPAAATGAQPGSPGIGDPYFPNYGNGGYDVEHYDIDVNYQPKTDHLSGTTRITARATQELSSFNLDFALQPESVAVNGQPAQFSQQGSEVTVTPGSEVSTGDTLSVVVDYSGVPSEVEADGVSPWIRTQDGAMAVGQPEISAWWFPGNDHPRDKARYDVAVTVPQGTQVLSNGLPAGHRSGAGSTTWNWHNATGTATYLQFLAIGKYDVENKSGAFGQPFITGYSRGLGELREPARASVERTPEVLRFLSGLVGDYPFPAQGGVVASTKDMGFALENQTRPTYSPLFFTDGQNTSVVVHELAHQWFGDSVSVDTWRDIWVNEGFASYAEWLWSEHQGEGTAQELFDHYYSQYPADDPFWQVTPGDPGKDNVFASAVYDRGAMTLQALRNRIGGEALNAAAREWVKDKADSTGTVEEFIALAEKHSGQDLGGFFDTWLFTPGKPEPTPENGFPQGRARTSAHAPASVAELDRTHRLLAQQHAHE
ncbi:M1 family metallopeptidase [Salinifilum aidingensis]